MAKEQRRARSYSKTVLDPRFPIPTGAENEFEHDVQITLDEDDISVEYDTNEFVEGDSDAVDVPGNVLDTPESITIVSQKLRRAPGGQNVIDIVIEIGDVDGAVDYEIQIA